MRCLLPGCGFDSRALRSGNLGGLHKDTISCHLLPSCALFSSACCAVENKVPTPIAIPSLNTAARGEFRGNRAESPSCTNVQHALENKAYDGNKRQHVVSCVNYHNVPYGGGGNRTQTRKSLQHNSLEQSQGSTVIKSVIIPDNPENEQLSDVISAWSSLPDNIREAILLLIRSQVR